jgi:hypothetical protein
MKPDCLQRRERGQQLHAGTTVLATIGIAQHGKRGAEHANALLPAAVQCEEALRTGVTRAIKPACPTVTA